MNGPMVMRIYHELGIMNNPLLWAQVQVKIINWAFKTLTYSFPLWFVN